MDVFNERVSKSFEWLDIFIERVSKSFERMDVSTEQVIKPFKRLDVSTERVIKFLDDLRNVPWGTAYIYEDVDDLWHHWAKLYNEVLDNRALSVKEKASKR